MRVKRLHSEAKLPTRAYEGDLGFDLYALEDTELPAVSEDGGIPVVLIRTGIAIEFPSGWGGFIKDRSSVAVKKKLHVIAGVIDNGYRGEIKVAIVNLSGRPQKVEKGERIAQLIPVILYPYDIQEADALSETQRGEGGFGSSG
ncbi:MAG: dUTP diphosphatase [Desulfurobacteriaceae bacterium]